MVTEARHEQWKKNFDQIEKDYDDLVSWWRKNKSCNCDSEEDDIFCKHYRKLLHKILGKRIDESFQERLQIGFDTIQEIMKQ